MSFRHCEGHCISFSQILTTSASTTSTTTALSFIIRLVNVPRRVWNEVLAQKTLRRNVRELTVDTNISRIKETVSLPAEKSNFGEIKVEWSWVIYLKANVRQKAWFRQSRAHSSTLWASRLSRTITLYSLKPWRDRRKQSAKNRNNYGNDFFHGDKNCYTATKKWCKNDGSKKYTHVSKKQDWKYTTVHSCFWWKTLILTSLIEISTAHFNGQLSKIRSLNIIFWPRKYTKVQLEHSCFW